MSAPIDQATTMPTPCNACERLDLANQLYREYHTRCFWHSPRDLVITEDLLPFVVKGLRMYGGRRGFMLSGILRRNPASHERDVLVCR